MSELERALVSLGRELDVPEPPDVAAAVLARLGRPSRRRPPRWAAAVAFAVLAAVVATLSVPEARSALFRVLHIGGERIEFADELPAIAPDAPGLAAALGEEVTLAEARRRAGFDLRELVQDSAPDGVYLGSRGTVWFLWGTPSEVRLLLAQTPGLGVDEALFLKKVASPETQVERTSVDGEPAFFLSGEPHYVILLDEFGNPVEETAWLARSVLVWEDGDVAYRLEGDFSRATAIRLAGSLR